MYEYNTPEYWQAYAQGKITDEQAQRDAEQYEQRKARALETSHRHSQHRRKRYNVPDIEAYTPDTAARLDIDKNLNSNACKTGRFLVRYCFQKSRNSRTFFITKTYIAKALDRCAKTIQRHLKDLVAEGYINIQIVRSATTGMVLGLEITLLAPLFPRHHREKWPQSSRKPDKTHLSFKQSFIINTTKMSRQDWANRCMNGIYEAFTFREKRILRTSI